MKSGGRELFPVEDWIHAEGNLKVLSLPLTNSAIQNTWTNTHSAELSKASSSKVANEVGPHLSACAEVHLHQNGLWWQLHPQIFTTTCQTWFPRNLGGSYPHSRWSFFIGEPVLEIHTLVHNPKESLDLALDTVTVFWILFYLYR